MPAKFDLKLSNPKEQLLKLGTQLKQHRKAHKWSAEAVATAAGLSRTTLHRIEAGEPSVAAGAYWAVVYALGLNCGLIEKPIAVLNTLPEQIELATYHELKLLAWHVQGVQFISPREAWDIYVRNWRHIDEKNLTEKEQALIEMLKQQFERPGQHV